MRIRILFPLLVFSKQKTVNVANINSFSSLGRSKNKLSLVKKSSISCLLLGLFIFAVQPSYASEYPRYNIKANVDVSQKRITAEEKVTFTNNSEQEIQELYLHVYPNRRYTAKEKSFMLRFGGYFKVNPFPDGFPPDSFQIQSVTHQGRALPYRVEGEDLTLLKISLEAPLNPGQSIEVAIDFSVNLPHAYSRFGWHENVIKASRWYPILSVYNEKGWNKYPFYPFHRPFFSEASHYSLELTVPRDQVVIHSGELVREESSDALTKTLFITSSLPMREFTFAMSPDYQKVEENFDGVTIKSFYLPGDQARAQEALESVKDAMGFYAERFGKYPYKEFSIAPVHLGYGGEQMANMIFIDTRVYKLPQFLSRYFDFFIAHETGHQWFFNMVGIDEYTQMWLEEGVNSYFIQEYLENKYGENAEVLDYPDWLEKWKWLWPELTFEQMRLFRYKAIARIGFDHPVLGDLASFREPSSIFSVTYGKGSKIVEMLEFYIGEEAFNRAFERIAREFQFKNLDVKDFIRICEEESGQKLDWFFDQWLYTSKKLDYAVGKVAGNKITFQNRGEITVPAEVKVVFADGQEKMLNWAGTQKNEEVVVGEAASISKVTIDPDGKLLDIDQTNNSWPRNVALKPVPLYLGLYDLPVFMKEDAYNVVFGPEIGPGLGVKAAVHKPYDQTFYAATGYEFGESLHHSRAGYQLKNLFETQTALGFEIANRKDYDGGEEDLASGKVYLRRELWPAQYGLTDINDHVTFYLIRNQSINDGADFISGREDSRNVDYGRRREAIVGAALHLNRSGPYPDPIRGYRLDFAMENAGHFLEATQFFVRSWIDVSLYQPVTPKTKFALRLKYADGYPDDKNLFTLGGIDGLRGFDRKTIRGANAFLGSLEYRFPIKEKISFYVLDNILELESINGVVFFDAGQSWYSDFDDSRLRKDAGFGLRFNVNIGSLLEKVIVRVDVAQAINESDEEPRFWFGLSHAF